MSNKRRRKPKKKAPNTRMVLADKDVENVPYVKNTIMVGFIHPGEVRGEFASSLFITARSIPEVAGMAVRQSGPRVGPARNQIVREFLHSKMEWLLFIDSDMIWSPDDVKYVASVADKDERPIVGGLCFADQAGQLFPTLYAADENGQFHVALEYPIDKVVPVDGTGAAFLLVHRRVYEEMQAAEPENRHPWFMDQIMPDGSDRGEDLTFCERATAAGFPIYVDTRAKIAHVKQRYLTEEEYFRQKELQRFIVVGSGRSGTGWAAELLSRLHIPTGHEVVFNPQKIFEAGGIPDWEYNRGESSWLVAPFLGDLAMPGVHLVRNPLEVVRSMMGIGFFDRTNPGHKVYEDFAMAGVGEDWDAPPLDEAEHLDRVCAFIVRWNEMIESHGLARFRIEDLTDDIETVRDMTNALGCGKPDRNKVEKALKDTGNKTNSRPRNEKITWQDVTPTLRELAERYGYEVD